MQPQAPHPRRQHQVQTQQLAEARGPETNPSGPTAAAAEHIAISGAAAETFDTQEAPEQSFTTSAQDASPQNAPVPPLATAEEVEDAADEAVEEAADKAVGDATAAEAADPGRGLAEEPYYASARGLRPKPVACALAGPTVHILLEGYVSHSALHAQLHTCKGIMC